MKSMKINEDQLKSMKKCKSLKINEICIFVWRILFLSRALFLEMSLTKATVKTKTKKQTTNLIHYCLGYSEGAINKHCGNTSFC